MFAELVNKVKKFFSWQTENAEETLNYRCINCGCRVKELYKNYSSNIQKIAKCGNCKEVVDKYVEFELLVIIIDLILLSRQAQRHVIFNTNCKNLWKVALIVTLLESYCLWMETFDNLAPRIGKPTNYGPSSDPLFLEKKFYVSVLQIVLGNSTLFTLIRMFTVNTQKNPKFTLELFRGFMLASIGKFFYLPIAVWKENTTDANTVAVHLILVIGYFIISLVYIHSVIANCRRKWSSIIILLAFVLSKYFLWKISLQLKAHLY